MSKRFNTINEKIKKLSEKDEKNIEEVELRNIYDLMSGYLESYVENKLFKLIITRYRPNIRMYNLEKMKNLDPKKIDDVIKLYNQTSRKGSRHSQPTGSLTPKFHELEKHFSILKANFHY